jgi:hypothetical protein
MNDDPATNITENGAMDLIKTQINDIMVMKETNLDRNTLMNDLSAIK